MLPKCSTAQSSGARPKERRACSRDPSSRRGLANGPKGIVRSAPSTKGGQLLRTNRCKGDYEVSASQQVATCLFVVGENALMGEKVVGRPNQGVAQRR